MRFWMNCRKSQMLGSRSWRMLDCNQCTVIVTMKRHVSKAEPEWFVRYTIWLMILVVPAIFCAFKGLSLHSCTKLKHTAKHTQFYQKWKQTRLFWPSLLCVSNNRWSCTVKSWMFFKFSLIFLSYFLISHFSTLPVKQY